MLARNEQGRWLETVLADMKRVCGKIIVLDDCSTDDTPDICRGYGAEVYYSDRSYWSTNELKQRKFLWYLATREAQDGEWILCLDADETMPLSYYLPALTELANQNGCGAISFPLFDMWDDEHYRDDELWSGHKRAWIMCVRYDAKKEYEWHKMKLHCGRFPMNAINRIASCPIKIKHWGWARPEDRQEKYERYMRADPKGEIGVLGQYESILDSNPTLRRFI